MPVAKMSEDSKKQVRFKLHSKNQERKIAERNRSKYFDIKRKSKKNEV
jgi:hypothetical protein